MLQNSFPIFPDSRPLGYPISRTLFSRLPYTSRPHYSQVPAPLSPCHSVLGIPVFWVPPYPKHLGRDMQNTNSWCEVYAKWQTGAIEFLKSIILYLYSLVVSMLGMPFIVTKCSHNRKSITFGNDCLIHMYAKTSGKTFIRAYKL